MLLHPVPQGLHWMCKRYLKALVLDSCGIRGESLARAGPLGLREKESCYWNRMRERLFRKIRNRDWSNSNTGLECSTIFLLETHLSLL